jgi:L-fucose dehydrogenase
MDLGLKDRVVIVTGGASGIGAAITRASIAEGARVVVLSRVSAGVPEFLAKMQGNGAAVDFREMDIGKPESCREAIVYVQQTYGRVDGLVNNAGVNDGVSLADGSPDRFEESLRSNLVPAYALAHFALPMLKAAHGSIVNIASKVAITGQGNTSGYAASKGGLLALTREWAAELLPFSIRVNSVIPAEVMTPAYETWLSSVAQPELSLARIQAQIPLDRRMTTVSEIAAMVLFLLSPTHSAHTTGQHVHVDGGYVHLDRMLTAAPIS